MCHSLQETLQIMFKEIWIETGPSKSNFLNFKPFQNIPGWVRAPKLEGRLVFRGSFRAFYVVFFPLGYILSIPPHFTYAIVNGLSWFWNKERLHCIASSFLSGLTIDVYRTRVLKNDPAWRIEGISNFRILALGKSHFGTLFSVLGSRPKRSTQHVKVSLFDSISIDFYDDHSEDIWQNWKKKLYKNWKKSWIARKMRSCSNIESKSLNKYFFNIIKILK